MGVTMDYLIESSYVQAHRRATINNDDRCFVEFESHRVTISDEFDFTQTRDFLFFVLISHFAKIRRYDARCTMHDTRASPS